VSESIYTSYFHLKDNWYFARRRSDGWVVIEHWNSHVDKNEGKPSDASVEMPPEGWASIVATVSALGETRETWLTALAFHNAAPEAADAD